MYFGITRLLGVCGLLVVGGCAIDGEVGQAESEIAVEQGGKVAEVVSRDYGDPEIARQSFATVNIVGGCSGTMIGPNIATTARHCGLIGGTGVTFRVYRNRDLYTPSLESFPCDYLYGDATTDVALYYCRPNDAGENPGDKYGYLDLDVSTPTVGQALTSVWRNSVGNLGLDDALLYSTGSVTQVGYAFPPTNLPIGTFSDLWSNFGASGSSQVNPANGRILVPALSRGIADGHGRLAVATKDVFRYANVASTDIDTSVLQGQGLTPSSYAGAVDKNGDNLFDVQVDLERKRGEGARDWYWLGFDSERRDALWTTGAGTTIFAGPAWAHLSKTTSDSLVPALTHSHLNLAANREYKVKLSVWAGVHSYLTVALKKAGQYRALSVIDVPKDGAWHSYTVPLTSTVDGADLEISMNGVVDAYVENVSVVTVRSTNTFNSADQRARWRNADTGKRALVLPDGDTTGVDWAGVAVRDPRFARGTDFSLANADFPFVPGRTYRLCFQAKAFGPAPSGAWGTFRLINGHGTEILRQSFQPNNWNQVCTASFTGAADLELQFGVDADPIPNGPESSWNPQFLVDSVMFIE